MTAKAKRRIIMGIASGCGRACERLALALSPITSFLSSFFFARSRDAT